MVAESAALRRGFGLAVAAVLTASVTAGCAAGRDAQTANQVATQDGTNANVGNIALRGLSLEAPSGRNYYAPGQAIPLNLVLVNNGRSRDTLTNIVSTQVRSWASYPSESQASRVLAAGLSRRQASTSAPSSAASSSASSSSASSSSTSSSSTSPSAGTSSSANESGSASASTSGSASHSTSASASSTTAALPTGRTAISIPAGRRVSYGVPDATGGLLLLSATSRIYPGTSVKIVFTFESAGTVTVVVPVQLSTDPGQATISASAGADEGN